MICPTQAAIVLHGLGAGMPITMCCLSYYTLPGCIHLYVLNM